LPLGGTQIGCATVTALVTVSFATPSLLLWLGA
jgi:hypothetical protein